jgi:hypothetical protein
LVGVGAAGRVAQGYTIAQTGKGAYDTTTKIINGQMDWSNPLSYLEVAGSYSPALGFGAKQVGKIGAVQNGISKATTVADDVDGLVDIPDEIAQLIYGRGKIEKFYQNVQKTDPKRYQEILENIL